MRVDPVISARCSRPKYLPRMDSRTGSRRPMEIPRNEPLRMAVSGSLTCGSSCSPSASVQPARESSHFSCTPLSMSCAPPAPTFAPVSTLPSVSLCRALYSFANILRSSPTLCPSPSLPLPLSASISLPTLSRYQIHDSARPGAGYQAPSEAAERKQRPYEMQQSLSPMRCSKAQGMALSDAA